MFELCPQCGNPWSDIEVEYQFCKNCGYQSPDDIDCMWDSIRKRINILNGLQGRSEELEELIREQESLLTLREFELRSKTSEINRKDKELNNGADKRKVETDRIEELFRTNLKKDIGSLFLAVGIIIKWGYIVFNVLMLTALTLGLFGLPIILIIELGWAWWKSILIIIPFWLAGIGLIFYLFEKNPSNRRKQRVMNNDSVLNKKLEKKMAGFEAKTLRLMWLKARVAQMKKHTQESNKDSSSTLTN